MKNTMIYKNADNDIAIEISQTILNDMFSMCLSVGDCETGGIIIGYYSIDLKKVIVTKATPLSKDSKVGRNWFVRGVEGLKRILNKRWEYNEYYLGEWHFHPQNNSSPSFQDKRQLAMISKDKNYSCPEPIMLIVGESLGKYEISLNMFFKEDFVKFYRE